MLRSGWGNPILQGLRTGDRRPVSNARLQPRLSHRPRGSRRFSLRPSLLSRPIKTISSIARRRVRPAAGWTAVVALGAVLIFSAGVGAEPVGPARNGIRSPINMDGAMNSIAVIRAKHSSGMPVRILPLGDSITQADMMHFSYRYYLWTMLIDAGVNFDFVGSLNRHVDYNPQWPTHRGRHFDPDHEGHWGWTADQILEGFANKRDERLSEWLKAYTPDIVLVHLGTNDVLQYETAFSTVNELELIIEVLREDNRNVIVLIAKVIPVDDARMNPRIDELNSRINIITEDMSNGSSPVIVVDHCTGFDTEIEMYDWLHPNEDGERKMAQRWFEALQSILGI